MEVIMAVILAMTMARTLQDVHMVNPGCIAISYNWLRIVEQRYQIRQEAVKFDVITQVLAALTHKFHS